VNSNIAIGSLPTLQTPHGLLLEKIYYGEPIFTGEGTLYTGFAEQFYAYHRMGPICLKISARIAERETYRMILLKTASFLIGQHL
jgi:hypothetical protein